MNNTIDLAPLQAHLDAIKARTLAWVAEDPKNRWACYPVDEAEFWAKRGITTVAAFEHDSLVGMVFEQYRDIYGFKPDWAFLNSLSDEVLKTLSERLSKEHEANKQAVRENRWARKLQKRLRQLTHKAASSPITVPAPKSGFSIGELIPNLT